MKQAFLVIGLFAIIASCDKDSPTPVPTKQEPKVDTYTVKYQFINQGDANVQAVALWTQTYFPKEEAYSLFDQAFNKVTAQDTLVKSIDGPYSHPAYPGCTTKMFIRVVFKEPVSSRYPRAEWYGEGRNIQRHYTIALDTLKKAEDAFITFRWPSDTLKLQEVPYQDIDK